MIEIWLNSIMKKKHHCKARIQSYWISDVLVPVIAVLILVPNLNKPMFRDEAFTLISSTQSINSLCSEITQTNFSYVFYYSLLHIWTLMADNIVWIRFFSLACYGGALVVVSKIYRLLMPNLTSIVVVLICALNPLFIQSALYARPYALSALLSSLFIHSVLKKRKSKHSIFLAAIFFVLLMCLTEIFSIILCCSCLVFIYFSHHHQKPSWKNLSWGGIMLLPLPLLLVMSKIQSSGLDWIKQYFYSTPLFVNLEGPASSSTGLFPIAGSGLYPIGVIALLCLGLLSYLTRRKNKTLRLVARWDLGLIATWAFLPTLAMVGISLVHPIYITRYITYSVPGLAILMAIACESIYTNFTLIKSQIVKSILLSSVLGAALVWTFITCDIPVAKTYAYNLWSAEKYLASSGGPNVEIVLPTISLKTAISYYANVDHNSFTYWPQGKNIWSATSLNLEKATFASASSNVWLVYENSYDDAPIVASLREHGYAQTGTTLIEGVALIHFERH